MLLLIGCGGDEDDVPEPTDAKIECTPGLPCGEWGVCQRADDAGTRACVIPQCELPGVGMGACCDLRNPDGSGTPGVCHGGDCTTGALIQASDRCEALKNN